MLIAHLTDIVKRYGSKLALDHTNLEIHEGEIVGLLGPNGAGKTTLIHSLAGLIRIDSGEIQVLGKRQKKHLIDIKRELGLVTQDITIFEDLTTWENLAFFGGIYGLKGSELKERIQETLEFVGLADRANSLPKSFSGGMKRRLNIACALTHRPKLLIMDEPTVGIDPQSRNHILESVRELQRKGTTILYTTHYMEEVQSIASRIVVMDQGQVIAQGTLDELINNIQHEEKIKMELIEVNDELLQKLRQLEGVKSVSHDGNKLIIVSTAGSGNLDRALTIARNAGGVLSITAEKPNLEDVFLTLTGKQLRDSKEDE